MSFISSHFVSYLTQNHLQAKYDQLYVLSHTFYVSVINKNKRDGDTNERL